MVDVFSNAMRPTVLLVVLALVVVAVGALPAKKKGDAQATPTAHIPSKQSVEIHHSLHRPLDQSQVYWNFGGSTVLTKKNIRLTPAAQNRRGWLWNDYPIESPNWEVEFQVEAYSKPHFGGDGMCFWLLDGSQDPTFHNDPEYLNGPIFGLKDDYQGAGVCFDVYDNDGKRDNPSIFVLYNPKGEKVMYNHDNDYADDMYKRVSPGNNAAYTCVAAIRNTEVPTKVMIKFLRKVLHVYVDTNDGLGYKFCLAVQFENAFKDHHIAFSAMTGQVADAHDLLEVSTKYLDDSAKVDDSSMPSLGSSGGRCSSTKAFLWLLINGGGLALVVVAAKELSGWKQLEKDGINPVKKRESMDSTMIPHTYASAAFGAVLLVSSLWLGIVPFLFTLPIFAFRCYSLSKNSPGMAAVASARNDMNAAMSVQTHLTIVQVFYIVSELYYLYRWVSCY